MKRFYAVTLFPEMFDSYISESIIGRAIKTKNILVSFTNPRKFVSGKYKKVWPDGNVSLQIDERPYGGGPGMVMMAEPVVKSVENILKIISRRKTKDKSKILIINFVPSAEKFNTKIAKDFAKKYTDIIMICGRYEGVDARVDKMIKSLGYKVRNISVGDYVLTGGEIPAMILIDSISRQIEGVLGNFDSREEERISSSEIYTRPEVIIFNGKKFKVPKVLLSGNHKNIDNWKEKKGK
ncbi:MAG: tRNA (guanosine(37)-N1)-methyltransferase TrmD [Candidatus Moranbacteria bacterium]|nr:tRNA (guanosine(37)-N1)-methyltransferase TrmD [Candidatus Moranbacteria bacterium]